jgi:hypothetical protein
MGLQPGSVNPCRLGLQAHYEEFGYPAQLNGLKTHPSVHNPAQN